MGKKSPQEKQNAVYKYLIKALGEGVPPTVREIALSCGIKSTSTVHKVLESLEKQGLIVRSSKSSRSIQLAGQTPSAQVPVLGRVTAGRPILAVEDIEEYITYPSHSSGGLFALRVEGLSMINAGILDGDIVVADRDIVAKNGDIVIGMDGDEATVKRLLIENGKIIFMPENPDYSPIYPENPSVLGKVIGSYRRY